MLFNNSMCYRGDMLQAPDYIAKPKGKRLKQKSISLKLHDFVSDLIKKIKKKIKKKRNAPIISK